MWPWHKFRRNPYLVLDSVRVMEAFTLGGKLYYQCETATELAAGRGISAMIIYDEFRQKCDERYLDLHIRSTEVLLKGTAGVVTLDHLLRLKEINQNLKERLSMVAMPDYIYKLASVYFWDQSESPYSYDYEYNKKKIEEWKKLPDSLSFFLTQPLKEFLPFTESQEMNAEAYLKIADLIDQKTQIELQGILSSIK